MAKAIAKEHKIGHVNIYSVAQQSAWIFFVVKWKINGNSAQIEFDEPISCHI